MKPERSEEKVSAEDIMLAARKLQVIAFAPKAPKDPDDPDGEAYLISMLTAMVSTREQLDWLTRIAPSVMRKFNFAELRGIFCSRFEPADGLHLDAETPGFRPRDLAISAERRRMEREDEDYKRNVKQWHEDLRREGAAPDTEPLKMLPPAKEMAPKKTSTLNLRHQKRSIEEDRKRARPRTQDERERLVRELKESCQNS